MWLVGLSVLSLLCSVPGKLYVIDAGAHYYEGHSLVPEFRSSASLSAAVVMDASCGQYAFDSGAVYGSETPCDAMGDANKLYGSSRCGFLQPHHHDSDRFTWRRHPRCYTLVGAGVQCRVVANASCTDLQFIAYGYDGGRMPYGPHADPQLMHVFARSYRVDTLYQLALQFGANQTLYSVRDANGVALESYVMPHRACDTPLHGYYLYPYFGGPDVAPQRVVINLNITAS